MPAEPMTEPSPVEIRSVSLTKVRFDGLYKAYNAASSPFNFDPCRNEFTLAELQNENDLTVQLIPADLRKKAISCLKNPPKLVTRTMSDGHSVYVI